MRRNHVLVPALLAFAASASAQTPVQAPQGRVTLDHGIHVSHIVTANSASSATIDDVVARVMSFDRNGDRKLAAVELPERMEGLVAAGDVDGDAALDTGELKTMARAPRTAVVQGGGEHAFGGSVYGFADAGFSGFSSSRSHVEGVIGDLRLSAPRKDRATVTAGKVLDTLESQRREALLTEMEQVLTAANLLDFRQMLARRMDVQHTPAGVSNPLTTAGVTRVTAGLPVQLLIERYSMSPEQRVQALATAKRFDQATLDETEQSALVASMKGVLGDEERDDFRAALARRPVVQKGGMTMVAEKVLVLQVRERLDNPSLADALVVEH